MKASSWFGSISGLSWIIILQQPFHSDGAYLRAPWFRDLQETPTQASTIPLFLTIAYVNDAIADSLESRVSDDEVVAILCEAVHAQVCSVHSGC
jgi:hypothetical protein